MSIGETMVSGTKGIHGSPQILTGRELFFPWVGRGKSIYATKTRKQVTMQKERSFQNSPKKKKKQRQGKKKKWFCGKNTCCSSTRLELVSRTHVRLLTTHNSSPKGFHNLFWSPQAHTHARVWVHTHTHPTGGGGLKTMLSPPFPPTLAYAKPAWNVLYRINFTCNTDAYNILIVQWFPYFSRNLPGWPIVEDNWSPPSLWTQARILTTRGSQEGPLLWGTPTPEKHGLK